jgi:hypothetical protein
MEEKIMATYKVRMCWDFIVEADSEANAETFVATLTDKYFGEVAYKIPEFAYETFHVSQTDSQGAGVDARL